MPGGGPAEPARNKKHEDLLEEGGRGKKERRSPQKTRKKNLWLESWSVLQKYSTTIGMTVKNEDWVSIRVLPHLFIFQTSHNSCWLHSYPAPRYLDPHSHSSSKSPLILPKPPGPLSQSSAYLGLIKNLYWISTVMRKKTTPSTAMAKRFRPTRFQERGDTKRFSPNWEWQKHVFSFQDLLGISSSPAQSAIAIAIFCNQW